MHETYICNRLFEMLQPYSDIEEIPISYIVVESGHECAVSEEELIKIFNTKKWNTKLSAVDLAYIRRKKQSHSDVSLNLTEIQYFEEDVDQNKPKSDFVSVFIGEYA